MPDEDAADEDAADGDAAEADAADAGTGEPSSPSPVARAMVAGLLVVLVLAGLCGWLGYRAHQGHQVAAQRTQFVAVARQAAVNLTSIDYRNVESDVQRVLEVSTDGFHDEFAGRAGPFVDVVKKAQSSSIGTVTEAGLESMSVDEGRVLVAVTVMSSNRGVPEAQPRYWRMRLTLTRVGDGAKVSRVDFA